MSPIHLILADLYEYLQLQISTKSIDSSITRIEFQLTEPK